jgi:hypothetical protein
MESGIRGTVAVVLAQAAQLDLFSLFHWDSAQLLEAVRFATPVMLLDAALLLPSYSTLGRQLGRRKPEPQALQQGQGKEQQQGQQGQQEQEREVWMPVQTLGVLSSLQATSKALHDHQVFSRRCAVFFVFCRFSVQMWWMLLVPARGGGAARSAPACFAHSRFQAMPARLARLHTSPQQAGGPRGSPLALTLALAPPLARRYSLCGLPLLPTQLGLELLAQASEELLARGVLLSLGASEWLLRFLRSLPAAPSSACCTRACLDCSSA